MNTEQPNSADLTEHAGQAATARAAFLGLWSPGCGSANALWYGSTLDAAAQEWRRLVAQRPDEEVDLTAYGAGEVASHAEMMWRYGTPRASSSCPICGQDTPHQHSGEAIARHRELEAWKQRDMERRWERIEARIAALARIHGSPASDGKTASSQTGAAS